MAFGAVAAASITVGLFLLFRYGSYQAVLAAGGSVVSWSPSVGTTSETGIFVPGAPSNAGAGWCILAYHSSLPIALAIGLFAGWRISTRTWPRAAELLGPHRAGVLPSLPVLIRCAVLDAATTALTLAISLAAGALVVLVAVMWPAALSALNDAVWGTESSSYDAFSAPSVMIGILFAGPACLLVAHSASQRVQRHLSRYSFHAERFGAAHS